MHLPNPHQPTPLDSIRLTFLPEELRIGSENIIGTVNTVHIHAHVGQLLERSRLVQERREVGVLGRGVEVRMLVRRGQPGLGDGARVGLAEQGVQAVDVLHGRVGVAQVDGGGDDDEVLQRGLEAVVAARGHVVGPPERQAGGHVAAGRVAHEGDLVAVLGGLGEYRRHELPQRRQRLRGRAHGRQGVADERHVVVEGEAGGQLPQKSPVLARGGALEAAAGKVVNGRGRLDLDVGGRLGLVVVQPDARVRVPALPDVELPLAARPVQQARAPVWVRFLARFHQARPERLDDGPQHAV